MIAGATGFHFRVYGLRSDPRLNRIFIRFLFFFLVTCYLKASYVTTSWHMHKSYRVMCRVYTWFMRINRAINKIHGSYLIDRNTSSMRKINNRQISFTWVQCHFIVHTNACDVSSTGSVVGYLIVGARTSWLPSNALSSRLVKTLAHTNPVTPRLSVTQRSRYFIRSHGSEGAVRGLCMC